MSNELLQQILNELKGLKTDVNELKENQNQTNERLTRLEESHNQTNERLSRLEESHNKTNERLENIEKKLDVVYKQTADLTEFRTETNIKLDNVLNQIKVIEAVTKENLYDIAKLKLIK